MHWTAWIYALLIVASFFLNPTNLEPKALAGLVFLCLVVHFAASGDLFRHTERDD